MSIRTSFNPLGTLGAELPYVQPVMTSATTWSNEPSFGIAFSGYELAPGAPWCAMIGPVTVGNNQVPEDYTFWRGNPFSGEVARMTASFERPLRFDGIAYQVSRYASTFIVSVYGVKSDGSEELLHSGANESQAIEYHSISSNTYFVGMIISVLTKSSGYGCCFVNLQFDAYYKK